MTDNTPEWRNESQAQKRNLEISQLCILGDLAQKRWFPAGGPLSRGEGASLKGEFSYVSGAAVVVGPWAQKHIKCGLGGERVGSLAAAFFRPPSLDEMKWMIKRFP